MSARGWILAALALTALPTGCATTHDARRPTTAAAAHKVDVQGVLVLFDGRAVADATVVLRCDEFRGEATTDREGRFTFTAAPAGRCQAKVVGTNFSRRLRLRSNLLRSGATPLRLVLPALRRVTVRLSWKSGDPASKRVRDLTFDEALPGGDFKSRSLTFFFHRGDEQPARVGIDLATGRGAALATDVSVEVLSLKRYASLPIALRPPPRRSEVRALPLRRGNAITTLGKVLGARSVLWVGRCARVTDGLKQDLSALAGFRSLGLRAFALTTDACKEAMPRPARKSGELAVLEGGPALRWALKAKDGDLFVVDESGKRLWRRVAGGEGTADSAVQGAVSFLRKSWPLFAATQKVSVRRSTSVSSAEAQRNLTLAAKAVARGDIRAAHAMLDRVLALSPDNAEARKQRTLLKAQLGDITGAMSEVGYWRETYGDEAADELLDLVQKKTSAKLTR